MPSPSVLMYVIIGTVDQGMDEEQARRVIGRHLDAIGGPVDQVDIETFTTEVGVIGVRFTADTRQLIHAAKRTAKLYFAGYGVGSLDELPRAHVSALLGGQSPLDGMNVLRANTPPEPPPAPPPPQRLLHPSVIEDTTGAEDAPVVEPVASTLNPAQPEDISASDEEDDEYPKPLTPVDPDALLAEALLVTVAERGTMRRLELAERLGRPVEVIDRILHGLRRTGYIRRDTDAVISLTEVGENEAGGTNRGRKGVLNLLLESNTPMSMQDLADGLGVTITIPKRAVRALMDSGYIEAAGYEPRREGQTARPRQLYRLTAFGRMYGAEYDPRVERKKTTWTAPTPHRASVIKALLANDTPLTANEIGRIAGVARSTARAFLMEEHDPPYIKSRAIPGQPAKFSLTDLGRKVGKALDRAGLLQGVLKEEQPVVEVYGERRLSNTPTEAYAEVVDRPGHVEHAKTYQVRVRHVTDEVKEMLRKLAELQGVEVTSL